MPGDTAARPDSPEGMQPGEKREGAEGEGGSSVEELAERLKRASEIARDAARNEQSGRDLRRKAEEMLRGMSPGERQKLEELARRLGGPEGEGMENPERETARPMEAASETMAVPPSPGAAPSERVIAEWRSDRPGADPAVSRREMAESFQRAAESAERAVEQQTVPQQRRELVKRVFRRFAERAGEGAPK